MELIRNHNISSIRCAREITQRYNQSDNKSVKRQAKAKLQTSNKDED